MLHNIYRWLLKKLREEDMFPWWKISLFPHPESKGPSYICKAYRKICFWVLLEFKGPEHSACSRLSLILHTSDQKNFHKISPPAPFLLPFPLVFSLFFFFYFFFSLISLFLEWFTSIVMDFAKGICLNILQKKSVIFLSFNLVNSISSYETILHPQCIILHVISWCNRYKQTETPRLTLY